MGIWDFFINQSKSFFDKAAQNCGSRCRRIHPFNEQKRNDCMIECATQQEQQQVQPEQNNNNAILAVAAIAAVVVAVKMFK